MCVRNTLELPSHLDDEGYQALIMSHAEMHMFH